MAARNLWILPRHSLEEPKSLPFVACGFRVARNYSPAELENMAHISGTKESEQGANTSEHAQTQANTSEHTRTHANLVELG